MESSKSAGLSDNANCCLQCGQWQTTKPSDTWVTALAYQQDMHIMSLTLSRAEDIYCPLTWTAT